MNPTLTLAIAALLAILGNLTLTKSTWQKRETLQAERQTVQAELERTRVQAARLPQLKQDVQLARTELTEIQREFPAQENLGALLQNIQVAGTSHHLKIQTINRQIGPSPIPGFNEVRLNLLAEGSYPATLNFLDWAYGQKRLLNVTALKSTSDRKQTISLTSYVHQP